MGTVATWAVMISALGLNPREGAVNDRVDLIEVNHFFDEHGKLVFDQMIFYDWCEEQCRYNVRAWKMLKKPTQIPQRNWGSGDYVAIWHDGDVLRKVRGSAMRETWTQYDPELVEREFLAKEKRPDLQKVMIAASHRRGDPAARTARNNLRPLQEPSDSRIQR